MKPLITLALASSLISCASNNNNELGQSYASLPHGRGMAICVQGDCANGYGTMQSPDQLEIEGNWLDGNITTGSYRVSFDGKTADTVYQNTNPTEGLMVYGLQGDRDYFIGKFNRVKYPFLDVDVNYPSEGVYYLKNGAELDGSFIFLPSMGGPEGTYSSNRYIFKHHPETEGRSFLDGQQWHYVKMLGNLVFVGELSYKGQSEYGVYAHQNYIIGSQIKLVQVKDGDILKTFQKQFNDDLNYLAELKRRQRQRDKESAWDINWGMVAALGAGVAMTNSSNLSSDAKAEFLTAYSKDVIGGKTDNLSALSNKYADDRSVNEIFSDSNKELQRIVDMKQQQNAQLVSSATQVNSNGKTNTSRTEYSTNTQRQSTKQSQQISSTNNTSASTQEKQPLKVVCKPIDQNGVEIPTIGIPKNRWCYRYSQDRPLYWTAQDIKNSPMGQFGYESATLEGARSQLELSLSKKAKDICKGEGYDGIYNDNYEFGELTRWAESGCNEKIRLGSTFYSCRGDATYRCGVNLK